ncbi:MAG: hypothetical protein IPG67_03785 [Acidobacteria bacterium]|nr:hypothetical protein [Acidobacteriota bacterium]
MNTLYYGDNRNNFKRVKESRRLISCVLLLIFTLLVCQSVLAQSIKTVSGNNFNGTTMTFVSQRCLPKDKVPYIGEDLIDYSDMNNVFRLENKGKREVYFLASTISNSVSPERLCLIPTNQGF